MTRRVLRYEVPVDDEWHTIELPWIGSVLHVAARRPDVVDFWMLDADAPRLARHFRVFGTGQPDVIGTYQGTALAAGGSLVWHLFEESR